jgi:hypothetical protein
MIPLQIRMVTELKHRTGSEGGFHGEYREIAYTERIVSTEI